MAAAAGRGLLCSAAITDRPNSALNRGAAFDAALLFF
jgi:hypothetical protein